MGPLLAIWEKKQQLNCIPTSVNKINSWYIKDLGIKKQNQKLIKEHR